MISTLLAVCTCVLVCVLKEELGGGGGGDLASFSTDWSFLSQHTDTQKPLLSKGDEQEEWTTND